MRCLSCLFVFVVMIGTIVFSSCGVANKGGDTDSDSIIQQKKEDSLANVPLPVKPLASVNDLVFDITVFDSADNGKVDNLRNLYKDAPGIFTFRGGPMRNAPFYGTVKGTPSKVEKVWSFNTKYDGTPTKMGTWGGGTGWTGEPVYVHWPKDIYEKMKKEARDIISADFGEEEIMLGSLCSNVYFINYQTGKPSRQPIYVYNPIKGSTSLDPTLNGNLYVGQGVPKDTPTSQLCLNLYTHSITYTSGHDSKAWVSWSGNDSSPVRVGQYLFWPSENGTIYKYLIKDTTIVKHSTLRFRAKDDNAAGVENSVCIYRNYGIVGNNHGDLVCFDINTLQPIWHYDNHDDIDGSIVCEVEGETPYLYSGCEVDRQGDNGICHFVKLNALNGEKVWEDTLPCRKLHQGQKHFDGGLYCTPLLGTGDCKDLLFANICQQGKTSTAEFIAFSKKTGEIVYRKTLHAFAWSSPVGFLNENGKMFIFAGDSSGFTYLFDGKTGEQLFCERMVGNYESSPIVKDNNLVVGSRGTEICKFVIK